MDSHGESGFKIRKAADCNLFKPVRIGKIGRQAARPLGIIHNQPDVSIEQPECVVVLPDHNRLSGEIGLMFGYVPFTAHIIAVGFVEVVRILAPCSQNHGIRNARIGGFNVAFVYRLPIAFVSPVQPFDLSVQTAFRMFQLFIKLEEQSPCLRLIARYHRAGKAADAAVLTKSVAERKTGGILCQDGYISA